ncbi:putative VQ motif-containing protein [Cinnamomum micranthum f. kanehirae]|uniref:Putative VQ motif-containing protein n=1 Tax=Cinnamomum micranthum f. kanehirae TaxID=337451 RepID=A0A443P7X9_9MAGN|nr:putative VQ motif-containing protein [Cinnamomum micranthum f. kanehirae]
MDQSDFPVEKSPRRELQLQGPRPTPLKIRKDSHKIKKPPMAPQPSQPLHQPVAQPRPPVIIYTVSPKVIHTSASEFMTLVQRLTGSSSTTTTTTTTSTSLSFPSSSASSSSMSSSMGSGALSPAARMATIEKAKSYEGEKTTTTISPDLMDQLLNIVDIDANVDKGSSFPGILSPVPSSLPPISPNFFSPSFDTNSLSFLHDFSPIFHGNKNYIEGNFMTSPTTAFLSAPLTSPTPSFDLFNQFFDQ